MSFMLSQAVFLQTWVSLSYPWAAQMGKLTLKEFCSCDNHPQCSHLWNVKYQWHLIRVGLRTGCATGLILAIIVWKCSNSCISFRYLHVCVVNVKRKWIALVSVKQEVPLCHCRCQIFAGSATTQTLCWLDLKKKNQKSQYSVFI